MASRRSEIRAERKALKEKEALGIGFFGPVILNEQSPKYGCVGNTPKLAWKWYPVLDEFKKALQIPVGFDVFRIRSGG